MTEYDGLPLNTPTKLRQTADLETWATRTANGGTVELRSVPGGPSDLANIAATTAATLRAKAALALTTNAAFLAVGAPTNVQTLAQVKELTRETNALIRLMLGALTDVTDT